MLGKKPRSLTERETKSFEIYHVPKNYKAMPIFENVPKLSGWALLCSLHAYAQYQNETHNSKSDDNQVRFFSDILI